MKILKLRNGIELNEIPVPDGSDVLFVVRSPVQPIQDRVFKDLNKAIVYFDEIANKFST